MTIKLIKLKLEATRKLRRKIKWYHKSQGTEEDPEVVDRLEELSEQVKELSEQKKCLEHRLKAMLSFPFPLVTNVDEYNDLLPNTLKLGSEREWVQWLRSHLRPDHEEWKFDNEILEQIKDDSLCWDACSVNSEFVKSLERLDTHFRGLSENKPDETRASKRVKPLQAYRQLIVDLLVGDWKKFGGWPHMLNRRIWNALKSLREQNPKHPLIIQIDDDRVTFVDDSEGWQSIQWGDSWQQALRNLKPFAKEKLSQN